MRDPSSVDPVKEATVIALKRVLDPLLELMFDVGVTVQEFNKIARDRAVRMATTRVIKETGRKSNSRVAIVTGIPRAEVNRILNSPDPSGQTRPDHHPARRVLAAWHDDTKFLAPDGAPAVLPIFGKRRTFQHLVEKHCAGIPVRAMLDELLQMDAVEQIEDQKVRAKARVPILTGRSSRSIAAVGERGRDLLRTLAHNVRQRSQPLFESTAQIENSDLDVVTLVRREISEQGANFINAATSLLTRAQRKRNSKAAEPARTCRVGVTVYYFQDEISGGDGGVTAERSGRRKNLRRQKLKQPGVNASGRAQ